MVTACGAVTGCFWDLGIGLAVEAEDHRVGGRAGEKPGDEGERGQELGDHDPHLAHRDAEIPETVCAASTASAPGAAPRTRGQTRRRFRVRL